MSDEITVTVEGLNKDRLEDKVVTELMRTVSKREILRAAAREKYDEALVEFGRDELEKTFNRIAGQRLSQEASRQEHRYVLQGLKKLRARILKLEMQIEELQTE